MFVLYHGLFCLLLPAIFGLLIVKVMRRRDYLSHFSERFGMVENFRKGAAPEPSVADHFPPPRFWLHAVSAGEAAAGIPLIAALREHYPRSYIAVSTSTPAGRAMLAAGKVDADYVFYCPFDLLWVVRRVVGRIAPSIFLLVETDLWPALLQSMKRRQIPMVLVNGRISLRRVAFRGLFQPVFRLLNHICVQTEVDAERLVKIGVSPSKISVTGNLKFAQALGQLDAPPLAEKRYQLPAGAVLLIAGSTHPGEEEHLLDCYRRLQERQRAVFLMIAPRHPERLAAIEALIRHRGYTIQRWSQFQTWQQDRITLVDSVGNLPRLYSLAHFVFVGGSFVQRGGHNILEPAAWGKPIFFGPYMENYSSIAEMTVRAGAAIRVGNGADLAEQVEYLINDPDRAAEMGLRASALVRGNQGVVDRDLQIIERVLSQSGALPLLDPLPAVAVRKALIMLLLVQPLWQ